MRLLLLLLFIYPAMGQSWYKLEESFKTKWEGKVVVNDTILIDTSIESSFNDSLCQIRGHVWETARSIPPILHNKFLRDTPEGSFVFYLRRDNNLAYNCIRCWAEKLVFRSYCYYKQVWP